MMAQILNPGTPNLLLTSLVGWLVVVNLLAFLAFFLDHRRALADQGAMPEGPLLLLSTMGGWLGAQLGQLCFQSQLRERSFRTFLNLSILPVLALVAMMAAQDVDWAGLAAKGQQMMAAQTSGPAEQTPPATAQTDPATPAVSDAAVAKPLAAKAATKMTANATATKGTSVTDNPDLPKRIGPSSKKEAWHSR